MERYRRREDDNAPLQVTRMFASDYVMEIEENDGVDLTIPPLLDMLKAPRFRIKPKTEGTAINGTKIFEIYLIKVSKQ